MICTTRTEKKPVNRILLFSALAAIAISSLLLPASNADAARERPLDVIFNAADSDGNGMVSENEWHAAMQQRFETMDIDGDGSISREEMEQSKDTARERFKGLRSGMKSN